MAKTKISEFSANPANNTDIDNINIAEGCAPSGINDAIRELMAQLKDFQAGTAGDAFNGNVVGNVTGNVTGDVSGNAGTVTNGVYTTGNQTITGVKTFGSNVQMTGATNRFLQINDSSAQITELGVGVLTGNNDSVGLNNKTATGSVSIGTNNATRVHVTNDGKVGIGTTTPGQPLTVAGGAHIADTYIGPGVIEIGDLGSGDRGSLIDFHSSGAPSSVDFNARIIRNAGVNNNLQIENIGTGNMDFITGSATRMFIASDGRINMPNNSASRGTSGYPIATSNDSISNAVRASGYIEWGSDIGAIGTNYFTSDIRKKENIAPSTYSSLGLVEQIEFVEFDWKPDAGEEGHVQVGVIAQQLQQLDPRLVAELSDGSLMIKEPALVTHLAKAIQEQQATITALTARIAALESAS